MASSRGADTGERFTLSARPPVRALAITAVTAVVGAALVVVASALDWPTAFAVIGVVLLALAFALAVLAFVLVAQLRVAVQVDAETLTIARGSQRTVLAWSDVREVALRGRRVVLLLKGDSAQAVSIVNPRGPTDPTFLALLRALQRQLDDDRGYRPF